PPKVYLGNVTVTEGDAAPTNAAFEVRLSVRSGLEVSMTFVTTNGSALGGTDYATTNGVITFAAGTTNQTILIPVWGDFLSESNETFSVLLQNLTNALPGDLVGLATVQDNDPLPTVDVLAPGGSVTEPPPGQSTNQSFTVTLSQPSGRTIRVKYATASGSALSGADFVANSGSLVFAPGTSSQSVAVAVKPDALLEPDETFSLNLSEPVNAVLGSASAQGLIVDAGAVGFGAAALSVSPGPILQASFHQGVLRIRFQTFTGERYALEWTESSATSAVDWHPVAGASEFAGNGEFMELTDPKAAG